MGETSRFKFSLKFRKLTPQEAMVLFVRMVVLPLTSAIVTFVLSETIKERVMLFFAIWMNSFAFVMFSYAIVKFKPLRGGNAKNEMLKKLLYVTFYSIIYTLSFVAILTVFVYGKDIPMLKYDLDTMVLEVYMQKIYVLLFMWFSSWLISTIIASTIIKV